MDLEDSSKEKEDGYLEPKAPSGTWASCLQIIQQSTVSFFIYFLKNEIFFKWNN